MNSQLWKIWGSICLICFLFTPRVFAVSGEGLKLASARSPDAVFLKNYKKKSEEEITHTTPVILVLENIEVVKTSSYLGNDEVYINVTEYSSVDKPRMIRVPEYPSHWQSKFVDKVQGASIWKKPVREGESLELIISLIEADAPPWDVDDLIGSVKLKVYLEKGKLEQEWTLPNKSITKQEGEKGHFVLTGDGAEYKISLKLKLDNKK